MPTQVIPDDVRRLIRQYLPSMSHVDVLVALARAQAPLTIEQIVRRGLTSDALALTCVDDLMAAGLVEVAVDEPERRYRLRGAAPLEQLAIHRLADIANARPVSLVRFVYERPAEGGELLE